MMPTFFAEAAVRRGKGKLELHTINIHSEKPPDEALADLLKNLRDGGYQVLYINRWGRRD